MRFISKKKQIEMKTFIDLFGKDVNLDRVDYFETTVKNNIEVELKKCNDKAVQYLKKHKTIKGFCCEFKLRNCLDKNENEEFMKSIHPEIKQIDNWGWISHCENPRNHIASTTVWDASNYSKKYVSKNN